MKLQINSACDLRATALLPPRPGRSERASAPSASEAAVAAFGHRPQALQTFSRGGGGGGSSLLHPEQSRLPEAFPGGILRGGLHLPTPARHQGFGSHDGSSNRMPPFPPSSASRAREGSQQQLAIVPNNTTHCWNPYLVDGRCQVNEDAECRIQQLASSVHKVGVVVDSVQIDAIRLNRAMKEAPLDSGRIQKKVDLLENSLQQILKGQNDLKVLHEGSTIHNPHHLGVLNSHTHKLNEISSTLSVWPEQVRADLRQLHGDIFRSFAKEMEGVVRAIRSINSKTAAVQMPESCSSNEKPQIIANGSPLMNQMPVANERLMMNQTPVVNGRPVMNRTPVANGSPMINRTPVGYGRPQMGRTAGTNGIPQVDRTPVANGRPQMDRTPGTNGIPQMDPAPATKLLPAPLIYSTRAEDPKPNVEQENVKGAQLVGSRYMLAPKQEETLNQKVNTQEPTKKAPVSRIIDSEDDTKGRISSVILNTEPADLMKEAGGQEHLLLRRWARKKRGTTETICIDATALRTGVTGGGEKRRQEAEPEEEKGESVHVAGATAKQARRHNPKYDAAQWAT